MKPDDTGFQPNNEKCQVIRTQHKRKRGLLWWEISLELGHKQARGAPSMGLPASMRRGEAAHSSLTQKLSCSAWGTNRPEEPGHHPRSSEKAAGRAGEGLPLRAVQVPAAWAPQDRSCLGSTVGEGDVSGRQGCAHGASRQASAPLPLICIIQTKGTLHFL